MCVDPMTSWSLSHGSDVSKVLIIAIASFVFVLLHGVFTVDAAKRMQSSINEKLRDGLKKRRSTDKRGNETLLGAPICTTSVNQ